MGSLHQLFLCNPSVSLPNHDKARQRCRLRPHPFPAVCAPFFDLVPGEHTVIPRLKSGVTAMTVYGEPTVGYYLTRWATRRFSEGEPGAFRGENEGLRGETGECPWENWEIYRGFPGQFGTFQGVIGAFLINGVHNVVRKFIVHCIIILRTALPWNKL